nr:hypothetical protein [Tanacetum cinerariifolium]
MSFSSIGGRKKTGGSASSTTPPTPIFTSTPTTIVVAAPRLSTAAKDVDEKTKGRDESEGDKTNETDDDDDNEEEIPKIDEQEVTKSDKGDDEATESDRENERMMIRKDLSLDQTGGLKDKKKEANLQQGLNLDKCLPMSLLMQRNLQTTCQMEETPHPVFETGADDQPIGQTSQHPEWLSQQRRPPSPDRAWNTTLPAAQGD